MASLDNLAMQQVGGQPGLPESLQKQYKQKETVVGKKMHPSPICFTNSASFCTSTDTKVSLLGILGTHFAVGGFVV